VARRIKITLSYDGTGFHGWQVQPGLDTIQGAVEAVISEIEEKRVDVAGSGRTDAGVHALAQVAAFTIDNPIPLYNLRKAMNRLLPAAVRIIEVEEVAAEFHPRFNARAKTYEYRIWCGEVCPPFERLYMHHFPYPMDVERFVRGAEVFAGEHDFTAFAASDEKDALGGSKVRTIFDSRAWVDGNRLIYRVRGSGFLKHMVRNLVGTMIEAGKGNLDAERIRSMLDPGVGIKAGPTAPARGLFLVSVEY
jgi:tRNA pseudouridine38-40 synthase